MKMLIHQWWLLLVCLFVSLACGNVCAESTEKAATAESAVVHAKIGTEGEYLFRVKGPMLVSKSVDRHAAMMVRIADVTRDTITDGDFILYELRFIGNVPGRFDLRDSLQQMDGKAIEGVEPLIVSIEGVLPDDHDGAIASLPALASPWALPYRWLAASALFVWLIPVILRIRNRLLRAATTSNVESAEESLADQMRPLVNAAIDNRLTTAEKSKLEFLLLSHWSDEVDCNELTRNDAIRKLKTHPEAGPFFEQVDRWLHQRPTDSPETREEVATEFLQAFR